jgi:flagellar FliL protein
MNREQEKRHFFSGVSSMADENEKKQNGTEEKQETKGAQKKSKLLFWGIIVGIIILELPIMYITVKLTQPKSEEEKQIERQQDSLQQSMDVEKSMGATTAEDPIEAIVNIAGTDGERFLKVVVVFEYSNKYAGLGEELVKRKPKLKNILIDILSKKTLVELNEPNAREMIRTEVLRAVNNSLPRNVGQIRNVLLDQFLIQ